MQRLADFEQGGMTGPIWLLIAESVAIVAVFALVGEGLSRLIRRIGKRAGLRETVLIVIRDTARGIWIVLAIVVVAFTTGLASQLTVLAVSTVGGLVLSLALQATLSNVIAGIFLLEDGTLHLGDDITYSGMTGKVVRITLRTTWVVTDKGVIATVANSQLMSGPLINRTATERLVARYHLQSEMPIAPAVPPQVPAPVGRPETGAEKNGGTPFGKPVEKPLGRRGKRGSEKLPDAGEP